MTIEYRQTLPDKREFFELFDTTGWNSDYRASPEEIHAAIGHHWCAVSAYEGDRLVGFGRVDSDGHIHAMIFDLIVHPEYQGRGIGHTILAHLIGRCRDAGIRDVQLFCARGKIGFYERHGFEVRPADAPGMQLRKAAENRDEHSYLPG